MMKILISTAVWGQGYCEIFAKYSLATLLAPGNIPLLATSAQLTFHIVTTRKDRQRLLDMPILAALARHCAVEWEFAEDYGLYHPPTGPGGKKYPFLSALQNLAITRSLDHDAIAFNYADFVWADGSLTAAVDMLAAAEPRSDAVFSFCLPVDRDWAIPALESHRQEGNGGIIPLQPRDAARIAIERMHREARTRCWDAPGFTNLPSYLIWPVEDQGVVLRAYHQSILVMRVHADDPNYRHGIVRGGLDSYFGGQLAKTRAYTVASDTDKVLVFSLYHTPVDSRLSAGVTREMSLQNLLCSEVLPEQRRLAEFPFFLRLNSGNGAAWSRVSETSWRILRDAQDTTPFSQAAYDRLHATVGEVVRLMRRKRLGKLATAPAAHLHHIVTMVVGQGPIEKLAAVAANPSLLRRSARLRRLRAELVWLSSYLRAVAANLHRPARFRAELGRLIQYMREATNARATIGNVWANHVESLLVANESDAVEGVYLRRMHDYAPATNISVSPVVRARLAGAIQAEDMASRIDDPARLLSALRTGETLLRRAMADMPVWAELPRALGRNLWFQGRFDDSIAAFAEGEALRDDMARVAGWPVDECLFLPRNCTEIIGLMGHIEAFAKYKILTDDRRPYYLLAGPQKIVNPAFLDYWKPYINVVTDPDEIARLAPREAVYAANWNWVMPRDGKIVYVHPGMAAVHQAWDRAGRRPLLGLRNEHKAVLAGARAKWGMKKKDRFVCLHVRSIGFYGAGREAAQQFRNLSIESYYAMIRMVTDRGLWVIRMGDSSMPPLDLSQCGDSGRVVDYALSAEKSSELDIALCASCSLFVGCSSGLHTIAHAFGRPVCLVNHPLYHGVPWHPGDIFIPQLYFSREKGRILTLEEILGTDVLHCDHQFLLARAGITLIPNRPDDILETVREALAPKKYRVENESQADEVASEFDKLNRRHDRSISGRLGRYVAAKYADYFLPAPSSRRASRAPAKRRKLDFLLSVHNRPKYLHRILATGLALRIPGAYFVVLDDASDTVEEVPGLGSATVEMVCRSFDDPRVIYIRNPVNMGIVKSLARYYREFCDADYTSLLNPKDEFIDGAPIREAIAKLDADPGISFVMYPLRQADRDNPDRPLLFRYERMSGRDFIAAHVRDEMLQHCGAYSVMRVAAARKIGIPRDLGLRAYGLEDASGFDHDMIFMMATAGDVDFVDAPPIRRYIGDGYTQLYPLTFAYCQYQYARRLMAELEPKGIVSPDTRRRYLSFWHLIIARGLVCAFRRWNGNELEPGVERIRPHLRMSILLYLPLECLRFRAPPRLETIKCYLVGARLLFDDWLKKIRAGPAPVDARVPGL